MSGDLRRWAVDLDTLAGDLRGPLLNRCADAGAFVVKGEALDEARKVTRDLRLSNYGTRRTRSGGGRKLNVRYPDARNGSTIVEFQPRSAWVILNTGARPHQIGGARRTRSGRYIGGRRRKVLKIGGRYVTGPIRHPGARGRHTRDIAVRRATPKVPDAMAAELAKALR